MGKPLENQIIVACGSTEPSFIYAAMKAQSNQGGFLCVRIQLSIQKEKSERISHLEDTVRLSLFAKE